MNILLIFFIVFYLLIAYGFRRIHIEVKNSLLNSELFLKPFKMHFDIYEINLLLGHKIRFKKKSNWITWLLWPITLGKTIQMALLYYTCKTDYFLKAECDYTPNKVVKDIAEIKDIISDLKGHVSIRDKEERENK